MFQIVLLCPILSQNSILPLDYDIYLVYLSFYQGHHLVNDVCKFVLDSVRGVGKRFLPNCHNFFCLNWGGVGRSKDQTARCHKIHGFFQPFPHQYFRVHNYKTISKTVQNYITFLICFQLLASRIDKNPFQRLQRYCISF